MDQNFVQNLHSTLQQTSVPDTNAVKAATEALQNTFFKNPACVPALVEILSSSPDLAVRQLASVELRKLVAKKSKFWTKQQQDTRAGIKAKLLELVSQEKRFVCSGGFASHTSALP
ncbi:unnamed protein product [Tilletia laevis]|nr:unnamed protein product [Tilletia laevis]